MTNRCELDKFEEVVRDYLRGKIGRRQFIITAPDSGLSAVALSKLTMPARAANLIDSDPVAPYELPITPERVAFLKTKPYKGQTINVMVCKITVGDCVKYQRRIGRRRPVARSTSPKCRSRPCTSRSSPICRAACTSTTPTCPAAGSTATSSCRMSPTLFRSISGSPIRSMATGTLINGCLLCGRSIRGTARSTAG